MRLPLDIYQEDQSAGTPSVYSPSDTESEVESSPPKRATKRKRASNSSAQRRRRSPSQSSDDSVYAVAQILARSMTKWRNPNTKQSEYRYLVRWEGYGPADDTWEPSSSLVEGSQSLIDHFEDFEYHPFAILSSKAVPSKPVSYLVRYGLVSLDTPPSPLYDKVWHTASQIHRIAGIPKAVVERAIRDFEEEEVAEQSIAVRGASPRRLQLLKDRCILAILAREEQEDEAGGSLFMYHVRWRDKMKLKEEWMDYEQLVFTFEEDGMLFVKKWESERGIERRRSQERTSIKKGGIKTKLGKREALSEYEMERLKNIQANRELMKDLGL
ncbi:hypothetical protein IAR50_002040 [Cryptococcus sp. DSM 104548]